MNKPESAKSEPQRQVRKPHTQLFDPMALMRWAGLAVLALLLIAVGAGFRNDPILMEAASVLGWLGPLAEPGLLDLSLLEWGGIIAAALVLAVSLWRGWPR